jgi:hypothetical protein
MISNRARSIAPRLVVEYELLPRRKDTVGHWIVEEELIETVDNMSFVSLSTASRGMARAIGADMSSSVPLARYTWVDTLRELRVVAVNKMLDATALARDPGYVPGKSRMPPRQQLEDDMPKVIIVPLPQFERGGVTFGPINVNTRLQVKSNKTVAVEMTNEFFDYFVAAMDASQHGDASPRKRCKHDERLSVQTGVVGIRSLGRSHGQLRGQRISVKYESEDGIVKFRTKVVSGNDVQAAANLLKGEVVNLTGVPDDERGDMPTNDVHTVAAVSNVVAAAPSHPNDASCGAIAAKCEPIDGICDESLVGSVGSSSSSAQRWSRIFPTLK